MPQRLAQVHSGAHQQVCGAAVGECASCFRRLPGHRTGLRQAAGHLAQLRKPQVSEAQQLGRVVGGQPTVWSSGEAAGALEAQERHQVPTRLMHRVPAAVPLAVGLLRMLREEAVPVVRPQASQQIPIR